MGHCITLLFPNDQWQRRKYIKHMSWNLSKNDLSLDFESIIPRIRQSMEWDQISDRLNTYFTSKRKLTKMHVKPHMLLNTLHPFHRFYHLRGVPPRNLSKSVNSSVSRVFYQNNVCSKEIQCCKKSLTLVWVG